MNTVYLPIVRWETDMRRVVNWYKTGETTAVPMFSCDGWCCGRGQFAQRNLCAATIQRAYRAFSFRKRNALVLAFAMGLHPRLGSESRILLLKDDVVAAVALYINPAPSSLTRSASALRI